MLSLQLQKSPTPDFEEKCGNSPDISKGISQMGMCKFESSEVSHAFQRSARLSKRPGKGPEIPAFRALALVSGLPLRRSRGGNPGKSPAVSAKIPVLRRLSAETRFDQHCRRRPAVDIASVAAPSYSCFAEIGSISIFATVQARATVS
jgi:hypothetical protein